MHECMDNAVAQLSAQLKEAFPKLPLRTPVIDGMVADASESGQLVLNIGAQNGLKLGRSPAGVACRQGDSGPGERQGTDA